MRRLPEIARELRFRVAGLLRRGTRTRELDEELAFHREHLAADLERSGISRQQAREMAHRRIGNRASIRERSREWWGFPFADTLWNDVAFAWRLCRRSPLFALVAISALGVSIGVNAGFFTLIDAMMFKPTPVRDPARLIRLFTVDARGNQGIRFSYSDIRALTGHATAIHDIVGYDAEQAALRSPGSDRAEPGAVAGVTGNYFAALGGPLPMGRMLLPSDEMIGAPPVAVISHHYWSALGYDPQVIGHQMIVNGLPVEIVGVAPGDFVGLNPLVPDLWLPLPAAAAAHVMPGQLLDPANRYIVVHARLAPGVTAARAEAEATSIVAEPSAPAGSKAALTRLVRVGSTPSASLVPFNATSALIAIPGMLIVALVLVIACANLANLLLGRAIARQREIAVRLAMGASRARLIRQLLVESLFIAVLGAGLGLWLANRTVTTISHSFFTNLPAAHGFLHFPLSTSWRVFAYAGTLACASVFLFGLAPALQATTPDLTTALKGEDRVLGTRLRRSRFRDVLIGAQVVSCVLLLTAAGILVQSLRAATPTDLGVETDRLLIANFGLSGEGNTAAALVSERTELGSRVARLPSVRATARILAPPFTPMPILYVAPSQESRTLAGIYYNVVTPSYFAMMHQPVIAGRSFTAADSVDASSTMIITASAAKRLWPGASAVGQSLRLVRPGQEQDEVRLVVGVVADSHVGMVWDDDSGGSVYLPARASDFATHDMPLLVERGRSIRQVSEEIAKLAVTMDRNAPLHVDRVDALRDTQIVPFRYAAAIAGAIGLVGLVLAAIGLYGVVSFAVAQRRHDLAVHLAMGATPRDVIELVMRREMRILGIALAVGVVGALGVAKVVSAVAIPLAPLGWRGLASVVGILALAGVSAMIVPAMRAVRIAPMRVLRQE